MVLNDKGIFVYFHSIFDPEFVHSDLEAVFVAVFVHTMIFVKFVIARIKVVQQRFLQDCYVLFVFTANIFNVIFTLFTGVPDSIVIPLYCLNLITSSSTVKKY